MWNPSPSVRPWQRGRRRTLAVTLGLLLGLGALELLARAFPSRTGADSLLFADYSAQDRANLEAWRERRSGIGPHPDLSGPVHHDPLLGWRNRPGLVDFVWEGRPAFSTNAAGMRGAADYALERTSQRRRVALLGDSFVFGLDQPDGRIFATLLAERLDAEVLNFGVPGYGTDQTYLMLMGEVLAWRPDDVVFGLFAEKLSAPSVASASTPNRASGRRTAPRVGLKWKVCRCLPRPSCWRWGEV